MAKTATPAPKTQRRTLPGIILRRVEFSNSSLILHVLTRGEGILSVMAKGALRPKSPFLGLLEPPGYLDLEVLFQPRREIQLLGQAHPVRTFRGLRNSLEQYYLTLYAVELMEEAGRPAGIPEVFDLFLLYLEALEAGRADAATLLVGFELKLLTLLGFAPALDHCAGCGNRFGPRDRLRFHPGLGGTLCPACLPRAGLRTQRELVVPDSLLRILARITASPWEQLLATRLAPAQRRQARILLDTFLQFHWERLPRTRPCLAEVFSR